MAGWQRTDFMEADHSMSAVKQLMESPFFFESSSGGLLFGFIHRAQGKSKKHGFVFCHPLAEEKLWAHRAQVSFARLLANHGYTVMRFDFYGEGDSDGEFEQSTLESRLRNVSDAIEYLKRSDEQVTDISLFGLRFGGAIAAIAAEQLSGLSGLLLWEPVLDGNKYVREMLRTQLATQLAVWGEVRKDRAALAADLEAGHTVNIDGYLLSPRFYQELVPLVVNEKQTFAGRSLIVQIRDRSMSLAPEFAQLAAAYPNGRCVCADDRPFWRETREYCPDAKSASQKSIQWLDEA